MPPLYNPAENCSSYGLITVLRLAQRLKVDLLPITWQAHLGPLGRGGQGEINQALVNLQVSFAFKHFDHESCQTNPYRETVQEMAVLTHSMVREHPRIEYGYSLRYANKLMARHSSTRPDSTTAKAMPWRDQTSRI